MQKLANIRGFWPYLFAIFLNVFIEFGHKIVIQNTIFKAFHGEQQILLMALINGLILLPFILLLSPTGFISDRYPKNRVMVVSAWCSVALSLAIAFCYYQGLFWQAFVIAFLLAVQSAFYSPAKYGYIKPLFGRENLAQANALVQSVSIIAVLASMLIFASLFESFYQPESLTPEQILQSMAPLAWLLVCNALFELWMAYRLPNVQKAPYKETFDWKKYRTAGYFKRNVAIFTSQPIIHLSIIGLAMFWSITQLLLASFPAYAKENLSITSALVIQAVIITSGLGMVIGSWIAGRYSKNHIETGLVPLGAIGFAMTLWFLPFMESAFAQTVCFFLVGMMGGLFIIPLNALIQFHAKKNEMGRVLGLSNWVQGICMVMVILVTAGFAYYGIDSAILFTFTAIFALVGSLYTIYKFPQSLARIVLNWSIARRYKVSIQGMQHVPEQAVSCYLVIM
ncbi:MFS transporter [Psychromonas sp. MME2]|uniref:MFS transporter n=1 Tax=Psychromonas sp. MME2 TaxID=3231033 RepID=UPI00339C567B